MANDKIFWDKIASSFVNGKMKDTKSYEEKLKKTQEYLTKEMCILEVACGSGMTAIKHAPFVKHVHVTDISSKMIEYAKINAKEANINNISFEVSDINSLNIENDSQDIILAMSIFHIITNPQEALKVLYKKLKPGGFLISSTICLGDKMNFFKPIVPIMRFFGYAPTKVHFLKKNDLLSMIKNQGFKIDYQWQPSDKKAAFIIAKK